MIGGSKDEPKDKKDKNHGKDQVNSEQNKKSGGSDQPGDSSKGGKPANK